MNALTLPQTDITALMKVGAMLAKSGYFKDATQEAQAVAKVLAGSELGIGPVAAMTGIFIVQQRVTLSANLQAALVKRSGRYDYRVKQNDDNGCVLVFLEHGKPLGESSFTKEDQRAAGLAGDTWTKYGRNMRFARALTNGIRWYCPDISVFPMYTPEELGIEVDGETGEPLVRTQEPARLAAVEPRAISAPPERPQPRPAPPNDETPQPPDQDAARRAFYGACDRRGLCERNNVAETRARVNGALGLPPIEGVLPAVAAEHGWDALRKHIEDATELPSDVLDRYWVEAMQEHPTDAPDDLAQQWSEELAAVAVAEPEGAVSRGGAHS